MFKRIVAGLFILIVPWLQWKGQSLRVCLFILSFDWCYIVVTDEVLVEVRMCDKMISRNNLWIHVVQMLLIFHVYYQCENRLSRSDSDLSAIFIASHS